MSEILRTHAEAPNRIWQTVGKTLRWIRNTVQERLLAWSLTVPAVIGGGVPQAECQQTAPQIAAPKKAGEAKEKEQRSLTYHDVEACAQDLGDEEFAVRERAQKELMENLDFRSMVFLVPHQRSPDLEIAKRAKEIIDAHRERLAYARCPLPEDADKHWLWINDAETSEAFRLKIGPDDEGMTFGRLQRTYLAQTRLSGADETPESDHENFRHAHVFLHRDLRKQRVDAACSRIGNEEEQKAFAEELLKNPKLDRGEWMVRRFSDELGRIAEEMQALHDFFAGESNAYRLRVGQEPKRKAPAVGPRR